MSEVTLTIRVKVHLLGVKDYFESEWKAQQEVDKALATSTKVRGLEFVRTDSVRTDGETPKMEVRHDRD